MDWHYSFNEAGLLGYRVVWCLLCGFPRGEGCACDSDDDVQPRP